MSLTSVMNRNRFVVAASCFAAVAIAGSGGDCIPNSNSCSCFDGTAQNIVDWRQVLNFNDCCATCVVTAATTDGCLNNDSCDYNAAKGAFESCGASGWPADEPDGFEPPRSCELFPATADNIVNWRTAAPAFCLSCVTGKLGALTPSIDPFSAEATRDAFLGCGLASWPTFDARQGAALVLPQSGIACDTANGSVPELTAAQLVDWRNVFPTVPACAGCILNRLQGGEFAYNSYGGVGGAILACGYEYGLPASAPDGFVPPGCANFKTGGSPAYGGIVDWATAGTEPIDQCEVCVNAWANGTAKYAPEPYPGECAPDTSSCSYDQTATAFNFCGTGGAFAAADDEPWPIPEPSDITPQLL